MRLNLVTATGAACDAEPLMRFAPPGTVLSCLYTDARPPSLSERGVGVKPAGA